MKPDVVLPERFYACRNCTGVTFAIELLTLEDDWRPAFGDERKLTEVYTCLTCGEKLRMYTQQISHQ